MNRLLEVRYDLTYLDNLRRHLISELSALIVAYRRSTNLKLIIQACLNSNIEHIYIAIDGSADVSSLDDVNNCVDVANDFMSEYPSRVFSKISNSNLGAAVSVLSACEWVFSREEFAVIIEDDCLPSEDFFLWVRDSEKFLISNSNVCLISGNQFAPSKIVGDRPSLSKYPLIWGWATSKSKWKIMAAGINGLKNKNWNIDVSYAEYCFWRSGTRRSCEGYVDAWDIPLAFVFQQIGAKSILPTCNLVSNTGGDAYATHTIKHSKWLAFPVQNYVECCGEPYENEELDDWYKREVFDIKFRHIFSTKISWGLDRLRLRKKVRTNLLDRIILEVK
jgi:hypothetical protein